MRSMHYLDKARHGPRCRLGGDSATHADTTTQNYDQRQIITNTLDGGAIAALQATAGGALGIASQAITSAAAGTKNGYDYADHLFSGATDYANKTGVREAQAYDHAATMVSDALSTVRASGAAAQAATQAAYADAKGTTDSQKQIMLGVLAVAGVIALGAMQKKG